MDTTSTGAAEQATSVGDNLSPTDTRRTTLSFLKVDFSWLRFITDCHSSGNAFVFSGSFQRVTVCYQFTPSFSQTALKNLPIFSGCLVIRLLCMPSPTNLVGDGHLVCLSVTILLAGHLPDHNAHSSQSKNLPNLPKFVKLVNPRMPMDVYAWHPCSWHTCPPHRPSPHTLIPVTVASKTRVPSTIPWQLAIARRRLISTICAIM